MEKLIVFARSLNAALLLAIRHELRAPAQNGGAQVATLHGDVNENGARDISDAVYLLDRLFQGGSEPMTVARARQPAVAGP